MTTPSSARFEAPWHLCLLVLGVLVWLSVLPLFSDWNFGVLRSLQPLFALRYIGFLGAMVVSWAALGFGALLGLGFLGLVLRPADGVRYRRGYGALALILALWAMAIWGMQSSSFYTGFFTIDPRPGVLLGRNLFWLFGHPEAYVLAVQVPLFGMAMILLICPVLALAVGYGVRVWRGFLPLLGSGVCLVLVLFGLRIGAMLMFERRFDPYAIYIDGWGWGAGAYVVITHFLLYGCAFFILLTIGRTLRDAWLYRP